jgi:tRNA-binding protein
VGQAIVIISHSYIKQTFLFVMKELIDWGDFEALDIRAGRILEASPFPEARKPAIKLVIDFGPLGIRKSSAQITEVYDPECLQGTMVIAIVNFPVKQIGKYMSECLVLGIYTEGGVVLLRPDQEVPEGARIG